MAKIPTKRVRTPEGRVAIINEDAAVPEGFELVEGDAPAEGGGEQDAAPKGDPEKQAPPVGSSKEGASEAAVSEPAPKPSGRGKGGGKASS